MKVKISATIDETNDKILDKILEKGRHRNKSHILDDAIKTYWEVEGKKI